MKNTEIPYRNLSTDYERLYGLLKSGVKLIGFTARYWDGGWLKDESSITELSYDAEYKVFNLNCTLLDSGFGKDGFGRFCNRAAIRFFDPEEPTTNLIQINEPFGYEYEATACCQSGPITNENYCPKCGRKIVSFNSDIQTKKSATINEQLSESEMKLHWQDQIISAFSKLAGGEKSYEFAFKQVRYQTEELLHVGVCSIYYNKF